MNKTVDDLRAMRERDLAAYDRLEKMAVEIYAARERGASEEELKRLINDACDAEYDLTGDCDAFGALEDDWEIDLEEWTEEEKERAREQTN